MATISVLPSRKLVYVDLSVWEKAGSGNTSTNKSTVEYNVVIRKGSVSWNTSWASWNTKIYATYAIDGLGTKTVYIPTYNYNGTCPPGTVIASGSFEVEHDSLGNKTIGFSLSFTDNADGNNDGSYYTPGDASTVYGSVDLANIPRYFSSTPSMTFKDKTETQIRYNWSTSETCDNITLDGNGTKSITGLPGTSGVITITGLSANTSYSHTGTFRRKDSQLTSNSAKQTNSTYNWPQISAVNVADLEIGKAQSLTLYNPLSRSVTIKMKKDSGSGTELYSGSSSSTSITFTPNSDTLYNSIPSAKSGKAVYQCIYGSTNTHTTTGSYTYKIKGTEVPTFTDANITNVVDTLHVDDITGLNTKVIKGHNSVTGTIVPMTANNKASGKRYIVSANANPSSQEISYATTNKTFTFENITVNSFTVTAYDTRELSTARTKTIDLVDYAKPKVNNFTITRQNGIGEYAILSADGTNTYWNGWSQIKKYNTIQKVYYRYKPSGSSTWSIDWTDITSSLTANTNGNWRLSKTLDIKFTTTTKYDFQIYVQDVLESSDVKSNTLSTANGFLWRDLLHKWLGINKKPTCELDVNGIINGNDVRIKNSSLAPIDITGTSTTLLDRVKAIAANEIFEAVWFSRTDGGTANISDRPTGTTNAGFFCRATCNRYNNSSDYRYLVECYVQSNRDPYIAYVEPSFTSLAWQKQSLTAYPIGSIYISMNSTNPKDLFGGTWKQLSGGFIYGTTNTSGTGSTGNGTGTSTGGNSGNTGASSAANTGSTVLTTDQIPSHSHQQRPISENNGSATLSSSGHYLYDSTNAWSNGRTNHLLSWPYTGSTGGGQGHTHTMAHTHSLNGHTHSIPYMSMFVWQRTA